MTSSKPSSLPRAPPPNSITLEITASTYEFWRGHKLSVHNNQQALECLQIARDGHRPVILL